jgi:hypothetical protein
MSYSNKIMRKHCCLLWVQFTLDLSWRFCTHVQHFSLPGLFLKFRPRKPMMNYSSFLNSCYMPGINPSCLLDIHQNVPFLYFKSCSSIDNPETLALWWLSKGMIMSLPTEPGSWRFPASRPYRASFGKYPTEPTLPWWSSHSHPQRLPTPKTPTYISKSHKYCSSRLGS